MTVNLSMLAGAGAQFFDNNGVPLAGGLVYTYTAGTTTPQAVYTTSSGSTAHTNPIVLDSAGRVPSGGEIWLTDAVAYKFVTKTSAAVLIGTYDNVTGNSSGIYAAFAASSGSSLVGYLPAGTGAVATTVQAKLRESVSVKDFGAVGNGTTDDTVAIQNAIDYCNSATNTPTLYIPAGTYKITDSIFVGSKTDNTRRTTIYIVGDGERTFPVTRGDNTNITAGTMIDATSLTNRPAIVIQGIFGGKFSDFSVLGSGFQQLYDLSLTNLSSTLSDWIPTGQTSGQYNPACAIAIDPYSGTTPTGGYSTGITYGKLPSSALRFDNVAVFGFVVGIGVSINNQGFSGDALRFYNCRVSGNTYGFAICGSQNRDIQYNDCIIGSAYTCWDTVTFGAKSGDMGHIKGGIVGLAYQIYNLIIQYNANSTSSLYSESIKRIGNIGAVNTSMSPGMALRSCYFKEETESAWNDKDPLFFPQGGGFSAEDCTFLPKLPWASLYGTSGSASTTIPPRFINCAFVTYLETGAPNPRPFTRWYVGEFKNLASARPIFQNCKTDMWEGNSEFVDSFNSCGDTIRYSGSTLPTRQVVINYSATRLTTRDNIAYNIKNISTYSQSTDNVTNKSWSGRNFYFDTAAPTAYAVGDYLFYGDSSLPIVITIISGSTITTECLFGVAYYDTTSTYYNDSGFRITIVNAQFVNSGAITGDITSGSNSITNVTLATTAFKVGDYIGSSTGSLPTNTRITVVSGTTLTLNKNATATGTGVVIGNLICSAV